MTEQNLGRLWATVRYTVRCAGCGIYDVVHEDTASLRAASTTPHLKGAVLELELRGWRRTARDGGQAWLCPAPCPGDDVRVRVNLEEIRTEHERLEQARLEHESG